MVVCVSERSLYGVCVYLLCVWMEVSGSSSIVSPVGSCVPCPPPGNALPGVVAVPCQVLGQGLPCHL